MKNELLAIVLTQESKLAIGFLSGLIVFIIGNYKRNQYKKLMTTGVKVEGTVVDIIESQSSSTQSNSVIYHPVISYKTLDGEVENRKYGIGTNPCPYKIDDKVKVIYDPADIRTFIMDDKITKFAGPFIMIAGGIIFLVMLALYFFPALTVVHHL
jgi:hypothetical protein